MSDTIEIVTVWAGNEAFTYLASEFEKLGTDAEPIRRVINPHRDGLPPKVELGQADAVAYSVETPLTLKNLNKLLKNQPGGWNVGELMKLIAKGEAESTTGEEE